MLGDHDALVAGELVPTALTRSLAVGDRALWDMPPGLRLPAGLTLSQGGSPDGPPDPQFVASFLEQALAGPTVRVPPDERRYQLEFARGDRASVGSLARVRRRSASGSTTCATSATRFG